MKKADTAGKMTAILAAVYTASYLSRFSYTIVLPEMVASTGKSKGELSVVVTILFVCYGIGQIISGVLADRLPPKALIFSGLFVSSCLNFAVPFIDSTGINNLRNLCERTSKRGVTVILSGVTDKVYDTLVKFGVDKEIGSDHIFPHIVPALEKAKELAE